MPQDGGLQPEVSRGLSGALSAALVGAPRTSPPSDEGEPLRQQGSSQQNRERFHESRRLVAAQLLAYSLPVLACFFLLVLGLLFAWMVIYIRGLLIFFYDKKPCDQPLSWWLLAMLLTPFMQCMQGDGNSESRTNRLQMLVTPILIVWGTWLCLHSKTCHETNPPLYQFVKMYLVFQTVVWALMMFLVSGLVALIFWLNRQGLLVSGPGPAMAAKPGLVHDFETVRYREGIGTELGGEQECCICTDKLFGTAVVKRTPCGHMFHEECLGTWLGQYARICPLCRADLEEAVDKRAGGVA